MNPIRQQLIVVQKLQGKGAALRWYLRHYPAEALEELQLILQEDGRVICTNPGCTPVRHFIDPDADSNTDYNRLHDSLK